MDMLSSCGLNSVLVVCFLLFSYPDMTVERPCFCLSPSQAQSGLVRCWCSGKLCLFINRALWPDFGCQAGSQLTAAQACFCVSHYRAPETVLQFIAHQVLLWL